MEEGENIDKIKKLLDWLYSTELTWVILILTCFIGLIELLPEIKYYGSSIGGMVLTFLLAFVALVLVGGCVLSIDKLVRVANTRIVLEQELPEKMKKRLHKAWGAAYKVTFVMDENGKLLHWKRWIVFLASSIFIAIWVVIIILKIYLTSA